MTENLSEYALGARDERVWGTWEVVTDPQRDGDIISLCEKHITVYPRRMLSLQMHTGRSEVWTVLQGTLTALINDHVYMLSCGEDIHIPKGTIHAMVNLGESNVIVHEVQNGDCRESDNMRLMDMAGRDTVTIDHPYLEQAKTHYKQLMDQILCA